MTAALYNIAAERAKRRPQFNTMLAGALATNMTVWATLIWWWL